MRMLSFLSGQRCVLLSSVLAYVTCALGTSTAQIMGAPSPNGNGTLDGLQDNSSDSRARRQPSSLVAIPEDFSTLQLASGFLLSMDIYDAPEFSTDLRVDRNGDVSIPTIGTVHVANSTITQASAAIAQKLEEAKILNHPQITLNVLQYAGRAVTILGEVHNPGRLELLAPHSLADVLAMSGGETQYAGDAIEIRRMSGSNSESHEVRFTRTTKNSVLADAKVNPGDTVTVRRAGIVYVLGGVNRPGGYVMQEGGELNVTQALALAYGTIMDAAVGSIHIIRNLPDGKVQEIPISYRAITNGKELPPRLKAEDVIYVPISKVKTLLGAALVTSTAQAAIYAR